MTDAQPESTEPKNLAPQADDSSLQESQAAIDDAKQYAAAELGVSEDEELAAEGAPVAGDSEPADGPAPAA